MRNLFGFICAFVPTLTFAASSFEGHWRTEDGAKLVFISEFDGSVTMNTMSYYSDGTPVNWFFQFKLPVGRDVVGGETISGRVRSVDAFYNCVFDEKAQTQLQADGVLKVHYPLLTYHRETRSRRENRGHYRETHIDWNDWGWVETRYSFSIEHYRVISSQCVIDQRNWVTKILTKTNSPFSSILPTSESKNP